MHKQINLNEIAQMAEQLIARYGIDAIRIAKARADEAVFDEFPSEKDIAFHVLTKVERLLGV